MRRVELRTLVGGFVLLFSCSDVQPRSITAEPGVPDTPRTDSKSWPTAGLGFAAGSEIRAVPPGISSASNQVFAYEGAAITMPAWTANGDRIAFAMTPAGSNMPWTIHVVSKEGSFQRLSPAGVYDIAPSWSPDATRLAFLSRAFPNGDDEIYVINADGTNRVQVTNGGMRARPGFPAWSPDGRRIAYGWNDVSVSNHAPGIYTINPDGTDAARLTPPTVVTASGQRPAWSPDGRQVAFLTGTQRAIGIINTDGKGVRYVSLPVFGANLAWSPDGSTIAFDDQCSGDDPECTAISIWLLHIADGSITRLPVPHGVAPAWIRL